MSEATFELFKVIAGPLFTVGLAWLAGNRISARWVLRQKKRELGLAVTSEFYGVYGDFFALWKLCNYTFRDAQVPATHEVVRDLLQRATQLEARMEALILRLASELVLSDEGIKTLGMFRQAVQLLRNSIRSRTFLGWSDSEHPAYREFKRLSVAVGALVSKVGEEIAPAYDKAQEQMLMITSNGWSSSWQQAFGPTDDVHQLPATLPAQGSAHRAA